MSGVDGNVRPPHEAIETGGCRWVDEVVELRSQMRAVVVHAEGVPQKQVRLEIRVIDVGTPQPFRGVVRQHSEGHRCSHDAGVPQASLATVHACCAAWPRRRPPRAGADPVSFEPSAPGSSTWVRMIMDVCLTAVLALHVLMRCMRVLKHCVVVCVAVLAREVLNAVCTGMCVVRDVHMIVPVYQRLMVVGYDVLLRHCLAPLLTSTVAGSSLLVLLPTRAASNLDELCTGGENLTIQS